MAGVLLFGAFVIWVICGFLYEMEIWQRIVVALATPVIGALALEGGIVIRRMLLQR